MPTVSIVIPCYNKASYVKEAIESTLVQTHPCEVIVVDDGSTDDSLRVIKTFGDRIRWATGPNRGASAARNTGIEMATGEWLQFLDADDTLESAKVSTQIDALEGAPRNSMASCSWRFIGNDGSIDVLVDRPFWKDYDEGIDLLIDAWLLGGYFPCHSWLVPRSLVDEVGSWNTGLTGDDDGEFFGRLLTRASNVRFTHEALVGYRSPAGGSVSRNRTLESAQSYLSAWEIVSSSIAERRWDRKAKVACLSRLRATAYALQNFSEVVDRAAIHERHIGVFDFSPALPPVSRYLIGLFGIKNGLNIHRLLKRRETVLQF